MREDSQISTRLWWQDAAILLLIMSIALGFRLYRLEEESMWFDEIISYEYLAREDLSSFLAGVRTMNSPTTPLYFVLEYFWAGLVSDSEYGVRMLSVLTGLGSVVLVFFLARRWFGIWAAVTAASLQAFSAANVYYDQEIRMYAQVVLLALISVYALWVGVQRGSRLAWGIHLLANVALIWSHAFGSFLWAAQGLWLAHVYRKELILVALWGAFHCLVGSTTFRYLKFVGLDRVGAQMAWVPPADFQMLLEMIFWPRALGPAFLDPLGTLGVLWPLVPVLMLGVIMLRRPRGTGDETHRSAFLLLVLWLLMPPLLLLLLSVTYAPAMVDRYAIFVTPALFILMGGAVAAMRRTPVRLAITLLFLAMAAAVQFETPRPMRPDFRGASALLEQEARPDDLVFIVPGWIASIPKFYLGTPPPYKLMAGQDWQKIPQLIPRSLKPGQRAWLWYPEPSLLPDLGPELTRRNLVFEPRYVRPPRDMLLLVEWNPDLAEDELRKRRPRPGNFMRVSPPAP